MNRARIVAGLTFSFIVSSFGPCAFAQQKCPAPPALTSSTGPNIFTPEQEVFLGDIEAERIERTAKVIHDDQLAGYLNHIVGRVLAQLPPTKLQFRVMLIDLPEVNAFSLPGGRIYVTRKMVAFARSEDELADLLGHEMGHSLSHQSGIEMTRQLREVLGVTSVGDRQDIADKFNRLLDNAARNPKVFEKTRSEEEPHQYQADQIGLYAVANAGYSTLAFADFFDRLARTKGKTGGWMSDFFGLTTPNEKRLREIRKNIDDLPAECRGMPSTEPAQDFLSWQSDVIAYSGLGRKEIVSGVLDKRILDPPLRDDVTNVKFSPDGKYLLAQDDSSIFVLSRDPLRLLFRVDAPESHPGQFTPDSQSIVFDTRGMRVEKWSVPDGERTEMHEVAIPGGCLQTLLSPDGNTLACVTKQFDLSLYEVAQGQLLFSKKSCFSPNANDRFAFFFWLLLQRAGVEHEWVHIGFSPDGKAFLGANLSGTVAVDLASRQQISLHGSLSDMVRGGFAFLAPDRIIAMNQSDSSNSAILKFPSGDRISRLLLGGERWSAAAHGNFLIVGPLKDAPTGVLDLSTNKFAFASKDNYAVDAFDQTVALQTRNGEIALFDTVADKLKVHTPISLSPLGKLRAGAVSPDLKWVALSGTIRGAVWNVSTSKRLYYTRGFRGAYFDGSPAFFADFPKLEPQARSIARLDLTEVTIKTGMSIEDKPTVRQWGQYLVSTKPATKEGSLFRNEILEVRDIRDGSLFWQRTFPKDVPSMTLDSQADTLLIGWQAETDAAKDELKKHPDLQARVASLHDRKNAWVLEDLNARTGIETGALVVDTGKGSFQIENAYAAGDWVVIVDSDGRTLVYSVSSGEQKGAFFGTRSTLSPAAGTLSIENEPGRVDLYALPSLQKRGQLVFSSPVALCRFSGDGKRFFVLTNDQTTYTFEVSRIGPVSAAPPTTAESVR